MLIKLVILMIKDLPLLMMPPLVGIWLLRGVQSKLLLSTIEAEFKVIVNGFIEMLWMTLPNDIGLHFITPMRLFHGNKASINLANNHV